MKSLFKRIFNFRLWLSRRYLPIFLSILAILLTLPALDMGLLLDDWIQKNIIVNNRSITGTELNGLFTQFLWYDGKKETYSKTTDFGLTPWWGDDQLRINFWRPIAEITHRLDYSFWPDSPQSMHIQSLIWLGLMILAVSLLYRKIFGHVWVAGLASLFYAVNVSHSAPAAWLANRYSLLTVLFSSLTIISHDKWRAENWRPGVYLGPFCFLLGLLSGEAAIAICAYLFAYLLFIDNAGFKEKTFSLVPYAAITLAYLIFYRSMDFGTYASDIYIDPFNETLRYALLSLERIPVILTGLLTTVPPDFYSMMPENYSQTFLYLSILFIFITGILFFPLIAKNRKAKFWALGMFLSLFPITIVSPSNRHLVFVAIGAMGLLAQYIGDMLDKSTSFPTHKLWRVFAFCMLFYFCCMHLIAAPSIRPSSVRMDRMFKTIIEEPVSSGIFNPESPDQQIILVNSFSQLNYFFILSQRLVTGLPVPKYSRTLSTGPTTIKVERIDNRTLVITPDKGFITGWQDTFYRGKSHPMKIGQKVVLTGITVEVLSLTEDSRPQKVKFTFDKPLEDPSYKFLQWTDNGYISFKLLSAGETIFLPKTKTFFDIMMEMNMPKK